jgi:hypothetical protein
MLALACNFNIFGARVFTGRTAVFVASLYGTLARQVRTLRLLSCRRHEYLFSYAKNDLKNCCFGKTIPGVLPSFRHPADQAPRRDSYRKRCRYREHKVML